MPSGTKSLSSEGQSGQRESTLGARCFSTLGGTWPYRDRTSAVPRIRAKAISSCIFCCAPCSSEHDMQQCANVSTAAWHSLHLVDHVPPWLRDTTVA
eukprot:3330884-Rhodomonas_salina.1